MKGHGEKLNCKKELATTALLSEPTIERAADIVGISATTL